MVGPSPLAVATVFSETRNASNMTGDSSRCRLRGTAGCVIRGRSQLPGSEISGNDQRATPNFLFSLWIRDGMSGADRDPLWVFRDNNPGEGINQYSGKNS